MICPKCKSTSVYVTETAHGLNNEIYRRRWCRDCDTKFRTVETIIDQTDHQSNKEYVNAIRNKSTLLKTYYTER